MEQLLTLRDFCQFAQISRGKFYKMKREGNTPVLFKAGGHWRISADAARDWVRKQSKAA